jgi:hypothetical protein
VLRPAPAGNVIEANGQVRGTEVTLSARIPGIAEVVAGLSPWTWASRCR